MERNGSKFIFCPFLEDGVLERIHERHVRREELTNIIRKAFAKRKYKHIPPVLIYWWMDKGYLFPLRFIANILEITIKLVILVIRVIKKISVVLTWRLIDWCIEDK